MATLRKGEVPLFSKVGVIYHQGSVPGRGPAGAGLRPRPLEFLLKLLRATGQSQSHGWGDESQSQGGGKGAMGELEKTW